MKLSVSLPDDDIEFLDEYARSQGYPSRSAVLHRAVRLLHSTELGDAYSEAWTDWAEADESDLWESTSGDGLTGI
jgi:Arc/MetJ-type ribon-helix-helix transcriptional regulator